MPQIVHTRGNRAANRLTDTATPPVLVPLDQPLTGVSIDLTTEFRWFFDGPLPADVRFWFMPNGVGLIEERCDRYRLDGLLDTGVKQRSRRTLELKIRTCNPEPAILAADVSGLLEIWRRWSPADGLLTLDHESIWMDIDKTVVKRRFGTDGREQLLSESTRAMTGEGCDAEIVALSANGREAWSFAVAAFGQPDRHRESIGAAWRSLVTPEAPTNRLRLDVDNSYGYPEWITRMIEPLD